MNEDNENKPNVPHGIIFSNNANVVNYNAYGKGLAKIFDKCNERANKGYYRLKVDLHIVTEGKPITSNRIFDFVKHLCELNKLTCVPAQESSYEDDDKIVSNKVIKKVIILW